MFCSGRDSYVVLVVSLSELIIHCKSGAPYVLLFRAPKPSATDHRSRVGKGLFQERGTH